MRHRAVQILALAGVCPLPLQFVPVVEGVKASPSVTQRQSLLTIDYDAPPRSWQEAIARCDVVALVKLTSSSQPDQQTTRLPQTRFDADVVESVAGARAGSLGRSITVVRTGGVRKSGEQSVTVQEHGFPNWAVGRTVLVFLKWAQGYQAYVLPFGPDSAFELGPKDGKLQTTGRGSLAARQNNRPLADVLKEIKAAR